MSLDQNLFTLHFAPHKDNARVVDLVDPSGTIHYRKQRLPSQEYKIEVYDPMSESILATASSPAPTSKIKTLELHNPTTVVELKYTGTLSFRWAFKWENHDFEWKREECFMIRKPDPPVIVAVTREPSGRLRTQSVQILDYNLNRFDIDDRKGLEIVILTALLTFQDANEAYHTPDASSASSSNSLSRASSQSITNSNEPPPPPPPPKPAPKTGIDRIAELQAVKGEYNEIIISDEGSIEDYGEYCNRLLQDDAMLFITVKSSEAEYVPKVLQVVEETKRIRHKAGLSDEEEIYQYVLYDTPESRKGPRRINLDDDAKNKYAPPEHLTVHLSKISMPELQPQGYHGKEKSSKESKKREDRKAGSARPAQPASPSPQPSAQTLQPSDHKLQRPSRHSSPKSHVYAHQVHPNQPSPSPSQLNNPTIYAAPPPTRPGRPTSSQGPLQFPQPRIPGGPSPSSSSFESQASGFPPLNWSGLPPAPPPSIHQPRPLSPSQGITSSTLKPSKSSTVVHGLMEKLLTRH